MNGSKFDNVDDLPPLPPLSLAQVTSQKVLHPNTTYLCFEVNNFKVLMELNCENNLFSIIN
jgi:hypothetical protein